MTEVLVRKGTYANETIENRRFEMVIPPKTGKKGLYVTVNGGPLGYENRKVRIMLEKRDDVVLPEGTEEALPEEVEVEAEPEETDEEIIDRLREKFQILDGMTLSAVEGKVRSMIVTGPPGVGKTFGIEHMLTYSVDTMQRMDLHEGFKEGAEVGIETGAASPLGLYQLLYQYKNEGSVLVLDDSDSILYDETSINMLKAATDSKKRRKLSWRTESRVLEDAGIPNEFEFEGCVIFITNLDFENTRGKIGEHLKAICSRAHYLDMEITTVREKFLRCKQIIQDGMLADYDLEDYQIVDILNYIDENKERVRELSLRMVTKVADLVSIHGDGTWRKYADNTCLKSGRKARR